MHWRRLASYGIDLLFFVAPWVTCLQIIIFPEASWGITNLGLLMLLSVLAALGTLIICIIQIVLFLSHRRTLGMACAGIVATGGMHPRAAWVDLFLLIVPFRPIHLEPDPPPHLGGNRLVDVLLGLTLAAPIALGAYNWHDFSGTALVAGGTFAVFAIVDAVLYLTTGQTIGSRAVSSRVTL
jgi:hypothetical protein